MKKEISKRGYYYNLSASRYIFFYNACENRTPLCLRFPSRKQLEAFINNVKDYMAILYRYANSIKTLCHTKEEMKKIDESISLIEYNYIKGHYTAKLEAWKGKGCYLEEEIGGEA